MRFVLAAAALTLALALPLGLGTAGVAHAELGVYFDDDGYRCEYNAVEDLVKIVCRDPRDFGDYYICFGDDRFVRSAEIPTREFLRRLGR